MGRRKIPDLDGLIAKYGIDPTEWEFLRWIEGVKKVQEWRNDLDNNRMPADFVGAGRAHDVSAIGDRMEAARDQMLELEADLLVEAKTWREYRLSKKRSVQGDPSSPLEMVVRWEQKPESS